MISPLKFVKDKPLGEMTTMKLGTSRAQYFYELASVKDLPKIHLFAVENGLKIRILGSGSNSLATDQDFAGIVLKNHLKKVEKTITKDGATYKVASGEIWDDFVNQTTRDGMTGLECTSGIPGTVGATPIQNVGAYGQEISSVMTEFEAYDFIDNRFITVKKSDLNFAYRTSTLKTYNTNRYFITSVSFELKTGQLERPLYWSLEKYITENNLTDLSPAKIREYVLAIRAVRIPDYHTHPSAGSFFENTEISAEEFAKLKESYPSLPYGDPQPSGLIKIPTAWLIEQTGLAGQVINGIEITPHNPMILVNKSSKKYADLVNTKTTITQAIKDKFGFEIEQEPIELI